MRPTYSAALRDLLDDVVQGSDSAATSARRPVHPPAWRTVATTVLVAAAVVGLTTVVLLHASPSRPNPPAADPTSTDITTPLRAPLVYLGLVPWSGPAATHNPTSTIYVNENWDPLRNVPGTCGIVLAKASSTIDSDGVVTITVRGYGYRAGPDESCSLVRQDIAPGIVHLGRTIDVTAVVDAGTGKKTVLRVTSHAGQLELIDGSGHIQWIPRTPAP